MPSYLFALVAPWRMESVVPANLAGVDGCPIRCLPLTGAGSQPPAAAWVATVTEPPGRTIEHLLQHDHVADAALAEGLDVIPARFGQVFADDAAVVEAWLGLTATLARIWPTIGGCVEMTLTVPVPASELSDSSSGTPALPGGARRISAEAGSTGTGRAYLEQRAQHLRVGRRARAWALARRQELLQSADSVVRAERERIQSDPFAVIFSHLVPRSGLGVYLQAVGNAERENVRVLVSGPHAPYSFATALPHSGVSIAEGGTAR